MDNFKAVTAEEIKHWLETGDGPDEGYPGWTKRLGETALRGLEMHDKLAALEAEFGTTIETAVDDHIHFGLKEILSEFGGGGGKDAILEDQADAELQARIDGDPDVAGACCPECENSAIGSVENAMIHRTEKQDHQ